MNQMLVWVFIWTLAELGGSNMDFSYIFILYTFCVIDAIIFLYYYSILNKLTLYKTQIVDITFNYYIIL